MRADDHAPDPTPEVDSTPAVDSTPDVDLTATADLLHDLSTEVTADLASLLVESIPDGLWVLDRTGRTVYANRRMGELLGRTPAQMVGFNAMDALDEVGQVQLRTHLHELETEGRPGDNLECSLLRLDGERVEALISHSPILDAQGRPRGWVHRVTAYTEQRRLLEILRRREQQLEEAQAIARIGSWEWDVVADHVTWSDQLYRMYNLESAEFVPTYAGFIDGIHPDDRALVAQAVGAAFEGEDSFEFDARILRAGGIGWIRGRGIVVRDESGAPVRMSGTAQDITDAKDTEQALALLQGVATAANDADTLADAVPAAIAHVTAFTAWRPQLAYLADDEGGLAELGLGDLRPLDGELAAVKALALETLDSGAISARALGEALLVAAPMVVAGRTAGVLVLRREGTAVPEPWEASTIAQAMALFARVAEREQAAAVLAAARDEAMSASRAKSEFLATMSHEIRTPLNGVIGLSELLSRTELSERQRRLTDGIEDAGRALLALVNDILDLSKIEAGRLELESVDFDPGVVIERAASLVAASARAKSLEFAISCPADLPRVVRGDPVRLGQVVTNLVGNAVKFTPAGEVVVRVAVEPTSDESEVRLRVEVSDTGVGIAPADQERLFAAFAQADSSTTRRFGGTGLGLAISSRIVSALGGEIGVRSEPGVGSTFWFTASLGALGHGEPAGTAVAAPLRGLRVLIVDDNETNRLILGEQVASWEAESRQAGAAAEALTILDQAEGRGAPFHLVLLDYLMPGVDGLELARRIRASGRHDATRLVLLTSAVEPDAQTLADAGVDLALAKPVPSADLRSAVGLLVAAAVRPEAAAEHPGHRVGRVLLVEDHPVNQMVAEGVLAALGFEVMVASDGAQAVAAFARAGGDLDVVLMDCQMPVMDGYDATRAIRASEAGAAGAAGAHGGRRVPIIALTAAAVAGERERCLDAGMDDFLTKPVDVRLLRQALERWVEPATAPDAAFAATPETTPETALEPTMPVVDPTVLSADRLEELLDIDPGDPSMLLRFIGRFGDNARATVDQLWRAHADGAAGELGRLAHGLKGTSANLGAHRLAARCLEVERMGEEGVLAPEGVLRALATEVEVAAGALEAFGEEVRGGVPAS